MIETIEVGAASRTLSARVASSSRLFAFPEGASTMRTLGGMRWRKSSQRRGLLVAAESPSNCCIRYATGVELCFYLSEPYVGVNRLERRKLHVDGGDRSYIAATFHGHFTTLYIYHVAVTNVEDVYSQVIFIFTQ